MLVVFPIIYKVLYIQTVVVWDFWTINSITVSPTKMDVSYRWCIIPQNKHLSEMDHNALNPDTFIKYVYTFLGSGIPP